ARSVPASPEWLPNRGQRSHLAPRGRHRRHVHREDDQSRRPQARELSALIERGTVRQTRFLSTLKTDSFTCFHDRSMEIDHGLMTYEKYPFWGVEKTEKQREARRKCKGNHNHHTRPPRTRHSRMESHDESAKDGHEIECSP